MLNSARIRIGLPLLAVAVIAAMAMWAFMGGATGGVKDGLRYTGTVEYKVFGPDGVLKDSKVFHNALNIDPGRDEAANRLTGAGALADPDLYNAAEGDGTASFSRIFAAAVARSAGADPQNYEANDGLENVGDAVEALTAAIGNNPGQATPVNLTPASGGGGIATVKVVFEAEAAGTIVELALVKAAVEAQGNAPSADDSAAIADANILATQTVAITLADEDTLEVTWTITVSGT